MVVKPRTFVARGRKGLVQPALKCRGPEYLRIIYGPEYDAPEHLARLRSRGSSSGMRRCSASSSTSRCVASMKRFSRSWRLKASRLI
jgi:protein phosphatase